MREIILSQTFKGAFKIALALVITYAVALSMGWNNPHWAGFAVAFCALATGGESLHKALLRIAGTFVAFFVTLSLIALFPQDRWLFFGALSLYLAFCNYMMGGTSRWYFWNIAAAGVPMLAFSGGPESVNAFDIVVLRAQMTVLGIVVYSLVSVLLWPSSTADLFEEAVKNLASAQHQMFRGYLAQQSKQSVDSDLQGLRNQVVRGAGGLTDLLNGAELDSLVIWETRHAWRQCIGQFSELNTRLDHWRHAFEALREIEVERMAPAFSAYTAEIDTRFGQIERMLAGSPPTTELREISLQLDPEQASQLSHFHRASIVFALNQLQEIGRLTQALFERIRGIRGFAAERSSLPKGARPGPGRSFDLDRAASVLRMLSSLWLALLVWIYLPDVPAYSAFMAMVCAIALMLMIMPQVPVVTLAQPIFLSILFAAVLHIFIMPQLNGFAGLAVMLFMVTFVLSYLFA
ncbi:MAG: FUSC family protein, partial [Actinomycetota bacterium]